MNKKLNRKFLFLLLISWLNVTYGAIYARLKQKKILFFKSTET